ncbi:hypothetical protein F5146DRAFT_997981 [Armillaria mellea]|nr:hypothetical protein F5146DRAFT_997981 [Armillaria mellea]
MQQPQFVIFRAEDNNQGKRRATLHIRLQYGRCFRQQKGSGLALRAAAVIRESRAQCTLLYKDGVKDSLVAGYTDPSTNRTYRGRAPTPPCHEFHPQDSNLAHRAYPIGYGGLAGKTTMGVKPPIETKGSLLWTVYENRISTGRSWTMYILSHETCCAGRKRTCPSGSTALLSNAIPDGLAHMPTENRPNKGRRSSREGRAETGNE